MAGFGTSRGVVMTAGLKRLRQTAEDVRAEASEIHQIAMRTQSSGISAGRCFDHTAADGTVQVVLRSKDTCTTRPSANNQNT